MSNDKDKQKKTREMTPKMFLHKATTKAANSAIAFLKSHRDFLLSGELAKDTYPIISRIDSGSLMPTPGLEEIKVAVLNHILNKSVVEATKKIESQSDGSGEVNTSKPYIATILNANGEVCTRINDKGEVENLIKTFDDGEHARNWCDRRLFDGETTWHGEITHTQITIKGEPWLTIVERQDSIARILKKKKGAITTQPKTSTQRLSFGVKAKQDRASFSKG